MSQKYDGSKLSDELKKKAWENLREDENLRCQALEQFREWITKHPKIKKCRMDDVFLLRFLRTKKFSVPEACQLLEKYLTTRKVLPQLFDNLSLSDPAIRHLISSGGVMLLPEPDKQGRLVITFDPEHYDPNKYTTVDGIRATNLILELANLDERSQICGIAHVMDWAKLTLPFMGMWTVSQTKNFTRCWQKTFPLRHGAFFFVNMPAFSLAFSKLVISCLSEKLRDRIYMVKDWESVHGDLGASILPSDCGGKVPRKEIAKKVIELAEKHREEILALNDFDIDVSDVDLNFGNSYDADLDSAIVGSFRKIQVD
ncbi:clavesin-2-like [Phlebotomus argentipes]|uniref:clavesin-2-like n=1 Tax=Phlebotomus argentipes TaxID=94469 RepID=UPI0028930D61|nr:clavesin-2-like [Phlebotomus argentipes]